MLPEAKASSKNGLFLPVADWSYRPDRAFSLKYPPGYSVYKRLCQSLLMGLVPFPQSLPALSLAVRFLPLYLPRFLRLPPIQITKEDRSLFQSVSQFPKKPRPSTRTPPSWKFPHSKGYKNRWNRFLQSGYRLLYGLLFLHLHTIHKDRLPVLFPLDCSGKTHKFYMVSPALSFPEGFSLSASFPAVQVLSPQTEKEPPKQFLSLYPFLFFPVLSDPGVNDLLHNLFCASISACIRRLVISNVL